MLRNLMDKPGIHSVINLPQPVRMPNLLIVVGDLVWLPIWKRLYGTERQNTFILFQCSFNVAKIEEQWVYDGLRVW